nr:cytochrome P450 [Xenococcaceae cyanobacterium MO_234.B1]
LMLLARDEDGQPMTDIELQDELMTMLVAGYETTATALTWALYWIHKLPVVKDKLLQELDSQGNDPEPLAIASLPYLTAVCNETLRIYPVFPTTFFRCSRISVEIAGQQFPPETCLVPCIYLVHHREDLYPEPKQFKPERFLERQFSSAEFIPFGGGNRRCLGYALAMLEMKLVLATILSQYELTLANKKPEKPLRRGLTLAPANGVKMIVTGERVREQKQALLAVGNE